MPSHNGLRKLVKRKEAGKTLQAKFADVYGLIADLAQASTADIDRIERKIDELQNALNVLSLKRRGFRWDAVLKRWGWTG